jgi:two-component system, NarL family, sensor histidine kinase UhpB
MKTVTIENSLNGQSITKINRINQYEVLIVEDDFVFASVIKQLLTTCGFEPRLINNSGSISEIRENLTELHPDVILLDLNIIDSKGESTFLSIKALFPCTPVIILSGMEDNELALQIVKDGAQDYILKSDLNSSLLAKSIEYGVERNRLNNSIQESERKFRNVFDNSPLPMFILHTDLRIESSNLAAENFYAYSKDKLTDMNINNLNSGTQRWNVDGYPNSFNKRIIQNDSRGRELHVELVANKISVTEDKYICLVIDRTDEYFFEQNKYKIINDVQEKEKKLLAMELHDGLCQQLVLLNLWLQSIQVDDKYVETKTNIDQLISSVITEARNLSYQLLPPDLENGFIQAIHTLVERMKRLHHISFNLTISPEINESYFTGVDIFNLYRIIQEFINNSIKHSDCSELAIEISGDVNKDITLSVLDNGKGFDMSSFSAGLGMQSIEHRIKMGNLIGGVFSEVDHGTTLQLKTNKSSTVW